jgi:hypothetical protein
MSRWNMIHDTAANPMSKKNWFRNDEVILTPSGEGEGEGEGEK